MPSRLFIIIETMNSVLMVDYAKNVFNKYTLLS